jgi:ATP adenylyltransferase
MKTLWTPWRMDHVNGKNTQGDGCLFEPPGKKSSSKSRLLLYRGPLCVVMLNRFPYANGHLLVAPVRHVRDLTELDEKENSALMSLLQKCCTIIRTHLHPHGINIGLNLGKTAGAGIDDHLHFHVVPRWEGDHNFMTVTADIRTIPQHIDKTFEMLLPDFQQLVHPGADNE